MSAMYPVLSRQKDVRNLKGKLQTMSQDVTLLGSEHVSGERSAAFLIDNIPLELWEHAHLLRCHQ